MSEPVDDAMPTTGQVVSPAIERIILANPRPDISAEPVAAVAEAGRRLLSAIPGVTHMSFGITPEPDAPYRGYVRIRFRDAQALQTYQTHPNHTTFGVEQWLPIIAEPVLIDCHIQYG